jgi:AcrR family transcriptional regulator
VGRPQKISDEEIARAARETFVEHGPRASVGAVAARLGVSQAALFHRAGSKEALMRMALAPQVPRTLAELRAGPAPGVPIADQLASILGELARFFRELVPSLVILRAAGVALDEGGEPPPLVLRKALASWLRRAAERGDVDVPDPAAAAEALLGALEARGFNAHVGGARFAPGRDAALVRKLVRALVRPTAATERARR